MHDHSKYQYFVRSHLQEIGGAFQNKSCFMKVEDVGDFLWQFSSQRNQLFFFQFLGSYFYSHGTFQFGPTDSVLVSQLERKHRHFRSSCASVLLRSCFEYHRVRFFSQFSFNDEHNRLQTLEAISLVGLALMSSFKNRLLHF